MKILLGLSGGVDSTYAALALKNDGHEVEAAVLKMHSYTTVDEAEESAASLGIPLHVIDCTVPFEKSVVENFISEYSKARTPNPCVICNSEVKFEYLYSYAMQNGFDAIATGHYAKIKKITDEQGEIYAVERGLDLKKDQTYMLWRIPQKILSKLVLPLGDMVKSDIRSKTKEAGLLSAERADSQEICFVPNGDYAAFVEERIGVSEKGDFVDESDKKLGVHNGIIRYTVGQRKGLGISASSRLFVTKIDPVSNSITLSLNDSYAKSVEVSGLVYSGMRRSVDPVSKRLFVKLRYAAPAVPCTVRFFEDRATVVLDEKQRAVTPGQSAVFYDGDVLVAGGFIDAGY
jgi:tRNA-specific 2-thiouridylase